MPANSPRRGDIYHLKIDEPIGPRYAVVVTANAINDNADTVLLALITLQGMDQIYPHEFNLPLGLLPKQSKVKGHALIAWPKHELSSGNYKAALSARDMPGLDVALMKALDLWY